MSNELTNFIKEHILKNRFNSNASKAIFWSTRGALPLYDELQTHSLSTDKAIQEMVYNYLNDVTELPKCQGKGCTNSTEFKNYKTGYKPFCSLSCMQKSDEVRNNYKSSMLSLYGRECNLSGDKSHYYKSSLGVSNPMQLKRNILKSKETKKRKYGDPNYSNTQKCLCTRRKNGTTAAVISKKTAAAYKESTGSDCMLKARNAFKHQTGFDNPSQLEEIQDKKRQNSIQRYGVPFQAKHLSEEATKLIDDPNYLASKSVREIIEETGYSQGHISKYMLKHNIRDGFRSSGEKELFNFIRGFYQGEVITNSRSIIPNKELDLYLPEFKLGIEYHGSYWHSDEFVKTHRTKYELCLTADIQLIQLFDFEWDDERVREIFKSIIKLKCGVTEQRIYARKCVIEKLTSASARTFLEGNHLDGKCNSAHRLGLYHKGELVSVMTFGRSRFKKNDYELLRFSCKKGCRVIGAASKLLKHFLMSTGITNLTSYCNNFYSNGNVYNLLGFEYAGFTQGHFYLNAGKKLHRCFLQKHKLKELYPDNFDDTISGREIAKNNGYLCIQDAGQSKYILNLHK